MNIMLISGHGGSDPGATASHNGVAYREADLTRKVTEALKTALTGYADVTIYDTGRNAYNDYIYGGLASRAGFERYDYVLEVHFNAFRKDTGDNKTKGTEIFVIPGRDNTDVEQKIVNAVSGVGLTNRGVKKQSFGVIATAERMGTRAALLEVCFIDDADDMKLYRAKQSEIVAAIRDGLADGLGLTAGDGGAVKPSGDRAKTQERFGFDDNTMAYLDKHPFPDALYQKLANKE